MGGEVPERGKRLLSVVIVGISAWTLSLEPMGFL